MNKAIFLDRDGVLIKDTHYVTSLNQVEFFKFSKKCIESFKKKGYLTIVVTNQSAIGRELASYQEVDFINSYIKNELGLDYVFFCPHFFDINKDFNKNKFNVKCRCRKPETLMGEVAIKNFNIDISKSYMIGDRDTDIEFGKKLGLKTVLVLNGHTKKNQINQVNYNYLFENLEEFSKILNE